MKTQRYGKAMAAILRHGRHLGFLVTNWLFKVLQMCIIAYVGACITK